MLEGTVFTKHYLGAATGGVRRWWSVAPKKFDAVTAAATGLGDSAEDVLVTYAPGSASTDWHR